MEQTILQNLLLNENYCRKVLPYVKTTFFEMPSARVVFDLIKKHIGKYNKRPTTEILKIELDSQSGLTEDLYKESIALVDSFTGAVEDETWLLETTEAWGKERAIYNGMLDSMSILKDKNEKRDKGEIPKILEDAIAFSFDTSIGHDYLADSNSRFNFYHDVIKRIRFDIKKFNEITGGGLPPKTLTVLMGGVGVGKTQAMCHFAASNLTLGKNVLYITLEMQERLVAERVDANLLDIPMAEMKLIKGHVWKAKMDALKHKTVGKLIIKEYPTGAASVFHFKHLLNELRLKKKFRPDIIYIDYLNICCSSRVKLSSNVGLYQYVKSITEEVRGMAVEYDLPIVTGTQLNREGYTSSDPSMEHTSESWGLPATVDLLLALITNDDLASLSQIEVKQIKNRLSDLNLNKKFIIGRDLSRMKFYEIETRGQIKKTMPF